MVGTSPDFDMPPEEAEPKIAVKAVGSPPPAVNRTSKGDPSIGLRPTFDINLRRHGALPAYLQSAVAFADSDFGTPPNELLPPTDIVPGPDSVGHFEPLPDNVPGTTRQAFAAASPAGARAGTTASPRQDGSTPAIARAVVLASSPPVAAGSPPLQIAPRPKL